MLESQICIALPAAIYRSAPNIETMPETSSSFLYQLKIPGLNEYKHVQGHGFGQYVLSYVRTALINVRTEKGPNHGALVALRKHGRSMSSWLVVCTCSGFVETIQTKFILVLKIWTPSIFIFASHYMRN